MPKVINTRKQRAKELLRKIEAGPQIAMPHERIGQDQIDAGYRLWMKSWIRHELIDLIPELRREQKP